MLHRGGSEGEVGDPSNKKHPGQCVFVLSPLSPIGFPLQCRVKVDTPSPPCLAEGERRGRRSAPLAKTLNIVSRKRTNRG